MKEETSKAHIQQCFDRRISVWCARLDLNQHSRKCGHYHLKVACLPIPPRARTLIISHFGLLGGFSSGFCQTFTDFSLLIIKLCYNRLKQKEVNE